MVHHVFSPIKTRMNEISNHPVTQSIRSAVFFTVHQVVEVIISAMCASVIFKAVVASAPKGRIFKISQLQASIIWAPILEELLFRGVLQQGIQKIQEWMFRLRSTQPPSKDCLKAQATMRIGLTAVAFGSAHFFISNADLTRRVSQFAMTLFSGVTWGILMEKYQMIAVPIVAHAMHNGIVYFFALRNQLFPLFLVPIALNVCLCFWNVKLNEFGP